MKKLVLFLLLALSIGAEAQKITGCGFKVPPRSLKSNFSSVYEAKTIVNSMLSNISWKENFNLREQNGIRNAYATIMNSSRWIVYDNNFLEDIDAYAATKWASVSILAHEMGHHYYNHVVSNSGSTPPKELEADAFSGYVMFKQGATLNESIAAISAIATDRASSTHPGKADRVAAITRGWNNARAGVAATGANTGGNTGGNPGGNTGTNPGTNPGGNTGGTGTSNQAPADDPSWISLTMQSPQTQTVMLSDDGKTYQQAEIKVGEPFVFKFEIYQYGWLKLPYFNGFRTFKLMHGKDYSILWNRRTKNWSVVEVPE